MGGMGNTGKGAASGAFFLFLSTCLKSSSCHRLEINEKEILEEGLETTPPRLKDCLFIW